ncbi:MAG: hypothetical protein AB8B63_00505 [Granulosicoccus sp.]
MTSEASDCALIETFTLGQHALLHNPASAAMVLAPHSAIPLLKASEGSDLKQADMLSVWRKAGLFEPTPYPPDDPVPLDNAEFGTTLVFAGPGGRVALKLSEENLIDQLACLLAFCRVQDDILAERIYRIVYDGTDYTAYDSTRPLTERIDLDAARFYAARLVCEGIISDVAASFHASAVARDGYALILVGESGRGKTTTALGLLASGCAQMSDDHVALNRAAQLCAFPAAIGLKAGTVPLPEVQTLLAQGKETAEVRDGVRYVQAHRRLDIGTALPVAAMIFPEFTSGAALELAPVTPEEALMRCIEAGARIARNADTAAPLVEFLNRVPCWHMVYSGSDQSIPACLDLFCS